MRRRTMIRIWPPKLHPRPGIVVGREWAVTRPVYDPEGLHVTHIPTGLRITRWSLPPLRALRLARRLAAEAPPMPEDREWLMWWFVRGAYDDLTSRAWWEDWRQAVEPIWQEEVLRE